jgi:hypothetical protein
MLRARGWALSMLVMCALASCAAREPFRGEVWLAPNLASQDYLRLFSEPAAWASARGQVQIFKFYQANLIHDAEPALLGNGRAAFIEVDAFRKLRAWGLRTAIEVGVLKPYGCKGADTARLTLLAIENVEAAGGAVDDLAVDEALYGGRAYCGLGLEASADELARFAEAVHAARPSVRIGIIEPFPSLGAGTLKAWVSALRARGFQPGFVQVDVDRHAVLGEGIDVAAALDDVHDHCRAAGIPFGVILWSGTSPVTCDAHYYDRVMEWTRQLREQLRSAPDQLVFQSWVTRTGDATLTVPSNLPDTAGDATVRSHTRLLRDALRAYGDPGPG